ncbi:MAG: APA family basic amino acid/polyamine antiporter [Hyphomicrobiaceae bacterium]|jgi:APA family basic amino acid/polyamine antiporter
MTEIDSAPTLRRSLNVWQVVLYGLGTTVGAGIYLLIGEVARTTGIAAPAAFLLSSLLAAISALSFCELVSRYPQSAGEAVYIREGFNGRGAARLVGLGVSLAGTVSAAVMTRGFVGYLAAFTTPPEIVCIALFVVTLSAVSIWGIGESVTLAGILTLIEVGGLALVIFAARAHLAEIPEHWTQMLAIHDPAIWPSVGVAALLAFYAFLGFEDMVNVAEEVRDAPHAVPLGILITLVVTTLLYLLLAAVCVLAVPPSELAESGAPLALVYERTSGGSPTTIAFIGVLAVVNGALIQIIMASRVLYGLASRGQLPAALARLHPRRRTPVTATVWVAAVVFVLAVGFPLAPLAEATSVVTLLVFASVNLALWRIKGRGDLGAAPFEIPRWIPLLGAISTSGLLIYRVVALFGWGI